MIDALYVCYAILILIIIVKLIQVMNTACDRKIDEARKWVNSDREED